MPFTYLSITLFGLGCAIVMSVAIRTEVKKTVAGDPSLAIDAPRFIRWFDLLWLEAVLFNAFMAFIIKCQNPFPPSSTPFNSRCVFWPLVGHFLLAIQMLSWAWRKEGPELAARFALSNFLHSPNQIKWETTIAAIGSLVVHVLFRLVDT